MQHTTWYISYLVFRGSPIVPKLERLSRQLMLCNTSPRKPVRVFSNWDHVGGIIQRISNSSIRCMMLLYTKGEYTHKIRHRIIMSCQIWRTFPIFTSHDEETKAIPKDIAIVLALQDSTSRYPLCIGKWCRPLQNRHPAPLVSDCRSRSAYPLRQRSIHCGTTSGVQRQC